MSKFKFICPLVLAIGPSLSGCGLTVPEMQNFYQDKADEKLDENTVVNQIKCELHKGVQDALAHQAVLGYRVDWLKTWGAKVTLTLTADEKGGLAPGLTYSTPYDSVVKKLASGDMTIPQSFSLAVGASASADATRKEAIGFTYAFSDLLNERPIQTCDNENGVVIHSDLKIGDFINSKVFIASIPGSVGEGSSASPYSTFSDEITFVVAYGANATPTWKLVQISASSNSPLANATRTKTQDIIITLGPVLAAASATGPAQLAVDAQNAHSAAVTGQAVATSIQSQQH
jgi:hypothetical protein